MTMPSPQERLFGERQDDEEGANDLGLQFFHGVFSTGEYTSPNHFHAAFLGPLHKRYVIHQLSLFFSYLQLPHIFKFHFWKFAIRGYGIPPG